MRGNKKGQLQLLGINMSIWVILALIFAGVIAFNLGVNPLLALAEHATGVIGIICAFVGVYLIVTKKEQKKLFGIEEGYLLILLGSGLALGSVFLELLQMVFGNTIVMLTILVFLFIYLGKKAGWIE